MQSVKSVLTGSDLSILEDDSYQTASGGSSTYKQYIYVSGETAQTTYNLVDFSTPTAENDPVINFKATGNQILTTYKLTFSTPVSLTSVTNTATLQAVLQGTTLSIMGKDFVISDCTAGATVTTTAISDMTLLGGKNTYTIKSGDGITVEISGTEYIVNLDAVTTDGSYNVAVGDVNGETFELRAGQTKTLTDGTVVAAIKILQGKTGEADFAKITIGADKIKVSSTGTIKKADKTITDVTATITSTSTGGWTGMTIVHTPSSDTFVKAGEKIADPFAEAFDIKFEGITPALDDEVNRQAIEFNPSQYRMKMKYANAAGDIEDMYSLYYDSGTYRWISASISATGQDNGYTDVVFDESQNISAIESDYFVVSRSGFSRVLQFSTWDVASGEMTFTDLNNNGFTATNTTASTCDLVVDGHTYKVYKGGVTDNMATQKTVNIDLNGDGYIAGTLQANFVNPTHNLAGAEYTYIVPQKITSGEGGLYFYKDNNTVTLTADNTWYYPELGFAGIRLLKTATTNVTHVATYSAGVWTNESSTVTPPYDLGEWANTSYTTGHIDYTVNCGNNTASSTKYQCNVALGTSAAAMQTGTQGYILVEEAQQSSTTHNWLFMPVTYDSTTVSVYMTTPVSDDSNYANTALTGVSTTQGMTTYGTLATYYTGASIGKALVSYPDSFAYGNLYVMTPEGAVVSTTSSDGSVTTDKVLPVTADIIKLDSEITDADKSNYDLILVGGPCVNTLVADLAAADKFDYTCEAWPAENMGIIQLVEDAFATGKTALLIAGTRAADTDLAARVVQDGSKLPEAAKATVTGESFSSVVVA